MKGLEKYLREQNLLKEEENISNKICEILKKFEIEKNLKDLKLYEFKQLSKIINRLRDKKYIRKNKTICRKKGFCESKFEQFIKNVENEKIKLLFIYMFKLGLRVGEAVKININDININLKNFKFESNIIKIENEKCGRFEYLNLPLSLIAISKEYIKKNISEILENEGYLFYRKKNNRNKFKFFSKDYVRKYFRIISIKCGINKPRIKKRVENKNINLYEYGTHSFRRGFCNEIKKEIDKLDIDNLSKNKLLQKAMRHNDIRTTLNIYLDCEDKQLEEIMCNF